MGKFETKALIHNSFLKHRHKQDGYKTSTTQQVFLDNKQQKKVTLRKSFACLAQSVEHAAVNRSVVGSSPTQGAKILYLNIMARWLSWLERRPVTAEVDGSSPFRVARFDTNSLGS